MFMDFRTSNRFELLNGREKDYLILENSQDVCRQDFVTSSTDNKLVYMFDELRTIRKEQLGCSKGIFSLQQTLIGVDKKVEQVINVTNAQTELLKTLAFRSIDLEARSRRNNLTFRGFTEKDGENCINIICDFFERNLDIDYREIYISRAHRLGTKNMSKQVQNRPIIVSFRDFGATEYIMSRAKMLKDTPYSIDVDLPREIQQARSRLWPKYKQYKQDNPRSKVAIVYPAKLIMDHRLIHDEMPEWGQYMRNNRLSYIEHIHQDRQQHVQGSTMNAPIQNMGQEPMDANSFPKPPSYSMVVRKNNSPHVKVPSASAPDVHHPPENTISLFPFDHTQFPPLNDTPRMTDPILCQMHPRHDNTHIQKQPGVESRNTCTFPIKPVDVSQYLFTPASNNQDGNTVAISTQQTTNFRFLKTDPLDTYMGVYIILSNVNKLSVMPLTHSSKHDH